MAHHRARKYAYFLVCSWQTGLCTCTYLGKLGTLLLIAKTSIEHCLWSFRVLLNRAGIALEMTELTTNSQSIFRLKKKLFLQSILHTKRYGFITFAK